MESISTFLEGVKAGYSDRFDLMFQAMGIEDVCDIRDMSEARLVQLRLVLRKGGAKAIQLDRINDAMDKLRVRKMPTKRPKSATAKVPLHIYTPCVASDRRPRPPVQQRRPRSAPPSRRTPPQQQQEKLVKVPEAPPVVMQRCSSGWQPREESRRRNWERLVATPRKTCVTEESRPASPTRTVRVSKQQSGDYPYAWELDEDRKKVWERLWKNRKEKETTRHRSLSPRPFVSPGPTATTPPIATKTNAVATAEKVVVFQQNGSWRWAVPQSRRGVWDRLLARPEKKVPTKPLLPNNKKQRMVSIEKISQDAREQIGLFKPLRVNGEHVHARMDRERFDSERQSSQRFVRVQPPPPRRFPLDVLLKTWTLEQIQATVKRKMEIVVSESPAPANEEA